MTSPSTSLVGALIAGVVIGSASTFLIGQRSQSVGGAPAATEVQRMANEQEAALRVLREEARRCQAARRRLQEKLVALVAPQSVEAGPSARGREAWPTQ